DELLVLCTNGVELFADRLDIAAHAGARVSELALDALHLHAQTCNGSIHLTAVISTEADGEAVLLARLSLRQLIEEVPVLGCAVLAGISHWGTFRILCTTQL